MQATSLMLSALLLLPGLASAGRSEADTALVQARSAVAAAERAGARELAATEFDMSRDLLLRADDAFAHRDWTVAENNAKMTKAEARLAEARSRQRRAESSALELEAAIESLRAEIARQGD